MAKLKSLSIAASTHQLIIKEGYQTINQEGYQSTVQRYYRLITLAIDCYQLTATSQVKDKKHMG